MTLPGVREFLAGLTQDSEKLIADSWTSIMDARASLIAGWETRSTQARIKGATRLEKLVQLEMTTLRNELARTIPTAISQAYNVGGNGAALTVTGEPSLMTAADDDIVAALAEDVWQDVLAGTNFVEATAKDLTKFLIQQKDSAGADVIRKIRDRGISSVVYSDGSVHGLEEYGTMLIRTKTSEAYQIAGMVKARLLGVQWVEIVDGPGCGLVGHMDPQRANGLILPIDEAMGFALSHPNCVRVTVPRMDITSESQAADANASGGSDYDLTGAEKVSGLSARSSRRSDGTLNPSAGAVTSVAQARHAALVNRLSQSP